MKPETARESGSSGEGGEGPGDCSAAEGGAAGSRSGLRRFVKIAGWLVTAASLVYVGARIVASPVLGWQTWSRPWWLGALVAAAVAHALLSLLMPLAWGRLLRWLGNGPDSARTYLAVYGRSQIAKYLPGNVFHIAGRQALASRVGWSQTRTATATVLELTSMAAAASVLGLLAFTLRAGLGFAADPTAEAASSGAGAPGILTTAGLLALLVAAFGMPAILPAAMRALASRFRALAFLDPPRDPAHERSGWRAWLGIYVAHLAFHAGLGTLLLFLLLADGREADSLTLVLVLTAAAPAWIAGTITPGASAGLGVREAALLWLLDPAVPHAVSAVLGLRLATIAGDVLFFGIAAYFGELPAGAPADPTSAAPPKTPPESAIGSQDTDGH